MHLFGSRGLPDSIRRVTGFGVHTFKLIDSSGRPRYCKFHFRPETGHTSFASAEEAEKKAGANADYHTEDLWDAIARGEYPVWKLYVQIMEPERAETFGRALFDITKIWSHKEFPLIEVGKMTLNKNVSLPLDEKNDQVLTKCSPTTTSPRLNKLPSRHRTWSLVSP
jgi:catalase